MNSLVRLVLPDVQDLLREGSRADIATALAPFHSADIADLIEELADEEAHSLLLGLGTNQQVETFEQLELSRQVRLVEAIGATGILPIIAAMASDDRADLMSALPTELTSSLLAQLPAEDAKDVALLSNYAEDTAGAIMTSEFVSLSPEMTVEDGIRRVRQQATSKELVYALYVRDADGRLEGVVALTTLILSPSSKTVGEIMDANPISVSVTDDQESVVQKLRHYDFLAIPVLDERGIMVGIVTHDDVLDVAIEEADEDAHHMGGLQPLDDSYFATALFTLIRKRAVWLMVLFVAGLGAGAILRSFEETLQHTVALIFFLPLIIAAGGNSGAQSATLVIRGLAVGDMRTADWWRICKREFASGLALGALLGLLGIVVSVLLNIDEWQKIALTVALTLVSIVTIGSLLGSLLPIGLARVGIDPAITSSPLVAALVDMLGILVYVLFAGLVIGFPGS